MADARYRKLYPRIWRSAAFSALSMDEKLVTLYCLTGPQTNRIGVYVMSIGAAAEDIGRPTPVVRAALTRVCETFGWRYNPTSRVLTIPSWFDWNVPEGLNVLVGNLGDINEVPDQESRSHLLDRLTSMGGMFADAAANYGATASASRSRRIPGVVREAVKARDGSRCRYCGIVVTWQDRRGPTGGTFDHIMPGGESTTSNIVIACRSCNSQKGPRTPEQARMVLRADPSQVDLYTAQVGSRSDLYTAQVGSGSGPVPISAKTCIQEQEQEQEQDLNQDLYKNLKTNPSRTQPPDAVTVDAEWLLESYPRWYAEERNGARCVMRPAFDGPAAFGLVQTWPDRSHLERMCRLFLRADNIVSAHANRGLALFADKYASGCDAKLRERGAA